MPQELTCITKAGETTLLSVLENGQDLVAGEAICFALNSGGMIKFGLEEDGYVVLYKLSVGGTTQIVWKNKSVKGQRLLVDEDSLILMDKDEQEVWEAGGCTAPVENVEPVDHELHVSEIGVNLIDVESNKKTLWSIDMAGKEAEYCPEYELEEGGIAGVIVGSFFAFAFAVALLVFVYRRNLGYHPKTSPVTSPVKQNVPESPVEEIKEDIKV